MTTNTVMEKPAVTELDIHPVIKRRWSPRSFDPVKAVEKEKIDRFLEAARWAPSGFNEQPWRFIVGVRGGQTWNKIVSTLVDFNQKWAQHAGVLVMTLSGKTLSKNGKPNTSYRYDAGGSVAYMTFQAVSDGLVTHQMGGFSKDKAIEVFGLAENLEPQTVIAIGYQDEPDKLKEAGMRDSETAPRMRRPVSELVLAGD